MFSCYFYTSVQSQIVPAEVAQRLFSEKLIYLPHNYQANDMPLQLPSTAMTVCLQSPSPSDRQSCRGRILDFDRLPTPSANNSAEGVAKSRAQNGVWMCSFNSNKKFEPTSWQLWMNILLRVPHAVLVLLIDDRDTRLRLHEQAMFRGISFERIVFLASVRVQLQFPDFVRCTIITLALCVYVCVQRPWLEHLGRIVACDLVVDTLVYVRRIPQSVQSFCDVIFVSCLMFVPRVRIPQQPMFSG